MRQLLPHLFLGPCLGLTATTSADVARRHKSTVLRKYVTSSSVDEGLLQDLHAGHACNPGSLSALAHNHSSVHALRPGLA